MIIIWNQVPVQGVAERGKNDGDTSQQKDGMLGPFPQRRLLFVEN